MAGNESDHDPRRRPELSLVLPNEARDLPAGRRRIADFREDRGAEGDWPAETAATAAMQPMSTAEVLFERVRAAQDRMAAERDRRAAAHAWASAAECLRRAHHDELSGALHRWPGMVELSRAVNQAHLDRAPLVVAFFDTQVKRPATETEEHPAVGDALAAVGQVLAEAFRVGDVVVRYGGGQFVCALPDAELPDAESRVAEVGRRLSALLPGASLSVGLVQLGRDEARESVVHRADAAMVHAKEVRLASRRETTQD